MRRERSIQTAKGFTNKQSQTLTERTAAIVGALGPISVKVYINGPVIMAVDQDGTIIANGTVGLSESVVIQAANDYVAAAGGGIVELLPGAYGTLKSAITISGKVILKMPPIHNYTDTDASVVLHADNPFKGDQVITLANRAMISGGFIRGNGISNINGIALGRQNIVDGVCVLDCNYGAKTTESAICLITNSMFGQCNYGLYGGWGFVDSVISNCYFYASRMDGISIGAGSNKNQFIGCSFEWNSQYGLHTYQCGTGIVNACFFDRNGYSAIYICHSPASPSPYPSVITGNRFTRNAALYGNAHIRIYASSDVKMVGNTFHTDYIVDGDTHSALKPDYVYQCAGACPNLWLDEDVIAQNVGIHFSKGYQRRMVGKSIGTGKSQNISHGLLAIPNRISIVPTVTGAKVRGVWADAINIYLTCTNGKAYNWSAEV